ncbi:MAG TPA: hypothetical protein VLM38_08720 [Blastocatellia bacterium]|nr:hypothetical protein [Blastocatellia bacterium]
MSTAEEDLANYSLLDALRGRRSRRFAVGMKSDSGPMPFDSAHPPMPLTEEEEALLVFAACGITGHALGDLVYAKGQGGNILGGLVGRTAASGDCVQAVALIVSNDEATYVIKRPQDLTTDEIQELIELVAQGNLTEFYTRARVKIKDGRSAPPVEPMFNINCNRWSVYQPGTTYFLPVNDLTFIYINGLLSILSPETGAYVLDERRGFCSAGLDRFARSKGGHLNDDPAGNDIVTIERMELGVAELATVEQGMIQQNLALTAHAMGLGGFPNFAAHEFGWFQALDFKTGQMSSSHYFGKGPVFEVAAKLLKRDLPVSFPLALEINGEPLLRAFCQPCYPTMRDAVMAVVERKFGPEGAFRGGATAGEWLDSKPISAATPDMEEETIEATIAYCEYVYQTYGRFPGFIAPFRTVIGFQAAHLELDFYDRYYKPEALSSTHREHMARWHSQ